MPSVAFDSKKYHREYAREYRKRVGLSIEQIAKRREYAKRYAKKKRETDPEWVERERARGREIARQKRLDPQYRKEQYRRHTEWARRNKDYINRKQRERNAKPENKLRNKAKNIKRQYGLDFETYLAMLKKQDGRCPICTINLSHGLGINKAVVDHDHETGKVRGIICSRCNLGLGAIEHCVELVPLMLQYLQPDK